MAAVHPTFSRLSGLISESARGGLIPDSGHYIPEEQPEALAREMLGFFSTL
jgi:pimeloyl-ACP methyl ester carboxylesterase